MCIYTLSIQKKKTDVMSTLEKKINHPVILQNSGSHY